MLVCLCLFIIGIFLTLMDHDELSILANTFGLVFSLVLLVNKKHKGKNSIVDSTKYALMALKNKDFDKINFKLLKKYNNPYINELKSLSEEMQKQQNRIQKRTRKLQKKNIQNTQLLQTISHEIKNPLSIIQASIETMIIQPNLDSNMQNKLLNRIMIYSKKINAMLNRLTLSQSLEHNVITVKMETFCLHNLVQEVVEGFRSYLLKSVFIDKKIIVDGVNREIFADKILIEQVLNNLIYNALKYAKSEVIVKIAENYFEVLDDGDGVDRSEIKDITKKFYQSKDAKKNNHSLGLGLFIVKEIAKIHNARLEFFSKRNKNEGLCVRIEL